MNSVNGVTNNLLNNLLGVYAAVPELLKERDTIQSYYNFFNGAALTAEAMLFANTRGQSWMTQTGLDFVPSQDIRNHVKKLMLKQKRFMFSSVPDVLMKPFDKQFKDDAEGKRTLIDKILVANEFWSSTSKAFLDATIGKRILLVVEANPDDVIRIKYYTMQEFTYEVDPNDYTKIQSVIIAYLDADTANEVQDKQIWHRWKYYMDGEFCWLESGKYNGNAEPIEDITVKNTLLKELPCKVIFNGGLTGDIEGTSDLKELIDLQNAYNKICSDYRDALRFKMFEQPVFINADRASLVNIKIAPNAMIDLQGDPAIGNGDNIVTPDVKMLSSTFTFKDAADSYLDRIKIDMYELMDQPRPEQLLDVPSAKALKFMFFDLIARCEEKWMDWEPSFIWMFNFIASCIKQFNLYKDDENTKYLDTAVSIIINHNYPIPEDEEVKKELAIKEVTGNVRSHKSYIRDFSDIEDEDGEWNEILAEQVDINGAVNDQLQPKMKL